MNLYEYISAYRTNPNPAVAKSLGADKRLVEYLKETPWNTSVNVVRGMCGSNRPSVPYTFHFTQQEIIINDHTVTIPACDKVNEWLGYFNSVESGTIVKATVTNAIDQGEPIIDTTVYYYEVMKFKENEVLNLYNGATIWQLTFGSSDHHNDLAIIYAPHYIDNYIVFQASSFDQADITLEIQPGYKTIVNMPNTSFEEIDSIYIAVEPGGSYTVLGSGAYTDGTNIYTEGDIITPTSDMILYPYTAIVTFYDKNHNLMQNLSYVVTQESSYPCSNPTQVSPGEELRLPTGINNTPLHGTWHDDNNNSYEPGDYVPISSDTNFTFVETVIQQEP